MPTFGPLNPAIIDKIITTAINGLLLSLLLATFVKIKQSNIVPIYKMYVPIFHLMIYFFFYIYNL